MLGCLDLHFNRLFAVIGDTYLAMKDKAKAKEWYEKTVSMPEGGSVAEREAQVR